MPKIKRVIISLSDKAGVVEFAKELSKMGVEILSTGGTAKALRDNKIPCIDVSDYTGSPEVLDGRLKTLHPKIHGGLLGMRGNPKHVKEMAENNIKPIDMVVVNLYPFEATIAKEDCTFEEAVENIDIGGPTMLRAAAKNWQDVAVVTDPKDYAGIIEEMKKNDGEVSRETCFKFAQKVFATTARYDSAICNYLNSAKWEKEPKAHAQDFSSTYAMTYQKVQELRYGENPHQKAAFYKCPHLPKDVPVISNGRQLHGKELSYNNIMDSDAAIELVKEFSGEIAAVVIKHTNPCGVAVSKKSIADAFIKARDCDPVSAFGGIVALTKTLDADTAKAIGETFFEVIIAPSFDEKALEILRAKKNLRLVEVKGLGEKEENHKGVFSLRKVGGGLLVQDSDNDATDIRKSKVATKRVPTKDELDALEFGWRVVKHVKSNAIVLATKDRVLGVGPGQTNRADSVRIAIMRAGIANWEEGLSKLDHSKAPTPIVLASDAFFPFRDSVDLSAKAGVTAIIQPGGSIRDEESILASNEHNISMIFTGIRHFRH